MFIRLTVLHVMVYTISSLNQKIIFFFTVLSVILGDSSFQSVFSSTLSHIKPSSSPDVQAHAVQDLIVRLIPERASSFIVSIDPTLSHDESKDAFKIEKEKIGKVYITGTTGVAAAAGFNHYLKYFCNCHISWEVSQLNIPSELPDVNITITFNDRFRYYQNVCTTSYSFVWWDWTQWEKHIDWMALNGFNLVLAFNGQEAIWEKVYQKFNLTATDIDQQFAGPAFLSWLRMGNMRGFAGPLSKEWHNRSLVLQKLILKRMRELGIISVLPAFAGHLPRAFKRLYPDANMVKLGVWMNFNDSYCCPYFLDPTESLFNEIGKAFINEQISEYGTDHVYSCDTFNEMNPVSSDTKYLANVGSSIYKAMTDSDPDAIWVMQNWMFVNEASFWTKERAKSMLTAVPIGKLIILDLMSENVPRYEEFDQYFGQPYIWCMLHNFGGTLGMFGSSTIINEMPFKARNLENSTMIGIGLTPEGINQNYVIYDLMIETAWRSHSTNLTMWFENYATRRYGSPNEYIKEAWQILQHTIYDYDDSTKIMGQYAIAVTPSFGISTWKWYSKGDLLKVWSNFLQASNKLSNSSGYLHDLVDITRQVLQVIGDTYYDVISMAYYTNNTEVVSHSSNIFLDIFHDMEAILATNEAFLLGRWINSAKNAANNSEEEKQFEYNARNQITLWGPRGEIMDYANKQWSGIVSHFFAPRWQMFLNYTIETMLHGQPFNQSYIREKIFSEVEEPFTFDRSEFPDKARGNTVSIAQEIYEKWFPILYSLLENPLIVILK